MIHYYFRQGFDPANPHRSKFRGWHKKKMKIAPHPKKKHIKEPAEKNTRGSAYEIDRQTKCHKNGNTT